MNKDSIRTTIVGFIVLGLIGAILFHLRYPFAFDLSNFYAEDGSIFIKNLLDKGPVLGVFTAFNGYLIVGQYLVGLLGILINFVAGGDFITLAKSVALASYIFLGFVCALPWLLFRKKIGSLLSLIVFLILCLTPLGSYDYAVIGTIGNLKFAFLFIALLLVIYRNDASLSKKWWQILLVDLVLLLCVVTNIVVIGLLPFIIIRYLKPLKEFIQSKKIDSLKTYGFISIIVMAIISLCYVLVVYLKGIPAMPGYLDGQFYSSAIVPIIYRATTYGVTFPVGYLFNNFFAILSVIALIVLLFLRKNNWAFGFTVSFALLFNIAGFVYNRPGVTEYFTSYQQIGWPGHFFYAGTMIVVFALAYVIAPAFNKLRINKQFAIVILLVLFTMFALPATGNTKNNPYIAEAARPTLAAQVETICSPNVSNGAVKIELYPNDKWSMLVNKDVVCDKD